MKDVRTNIAQIIGSLHIANAELGARAEELTEEIAALKAEIEKLKEVKDVHVEHPELGKPNGGAPRPGKGSEARGGTM